MQRLSVMILVSAIWSSVYGVPARPGLHKYRQPSGEDVNIEIRGDEYSHYRVSEDGYVLTEVHDTLYFAAVFDGQIAASRFAATNPESRPVACRDFLRQQNRLSVETAARQVRSNCRAMSAEKPIGNGDDAFGLFADTRFPRFGSQKALVILAEYPDVKFNDGYDAGDYFSRMLNDADFDDYNATGSARRFFEENSGGAFLPEFDVYGPIELSRPSYFYGSNDRNGQDINAARMIADACRLLDDEIDYTQYDRDGDGVIDNVFVFYAGRGEASGGAPSTIWPHSWDVRYGIDETITLDGKILGRYACTNEWQGAKPDGIGTFVHEFSHVLGLPDLYATSYTDAFTPGNWDVMDHGSYNNNSRTPPMFSAFERYALGWSDARVLSGVTDIELLDMRTSDGCVVETAHPGEKYFIENRQQCGWDAHVPGSGMVVWHVNYDKSVWSRNVVNNDPAKQYVDLIEADLNENDAARSGHSFPGARNVRSMSVDSHPVSRAWNDREFYLTITDIADNEGVVTAHVETVVMPLEAPEGLAVSCVTDNSFTAHWNKVDGATDYRLSVFTIGEAPDVETNGFDSGIKNMNGWATSTFVQSSSPENAGIASPSLMFSASGGYIDTPKYASDIERFSFWCKTYSSVHIVVKPEIMLYGKSNVDTDWSLIENINVDVNEPGRTITVDNIPGGTVTLRMRMAGVNGLTYYIDDCAVTSGIKEVYTPLVGFPIMTGDVDEIDIVDLPCGFTGGFAVEAADGDVFSAQSDVCTFELQGAASGVEPVYTEDYLYDKDIEIYNLQGVRCDNRGTLLPGMYIVKTRHGFRKLLLP